MMFVAQGMLLGRHYIGSCELTQTKALGIRWSPTETHESMFLDVDNPDRNAEIRCGLCNRATILITVTLGTTADPKGWQITTRGQKSFIINMGTSSTPMVIGSTLRSYKRYVLG